MKLATVDISRILDESKRGLQLMKRIKEMSERLDAEGVGLAQKLQELRDKLQKVNDVTPRTLVIKMQRDAQFYEAQLNQLRQRAQGEISVTVEHYRNMVLDEVNPIILSYAKEHNLSLVLPAAPGQVLFASPDVDITPAILAAYDKAQVK